MGRTTTIIALPWLYATDGMRQTKRALGGLSRPVHASCTVVGHTKKKKFQPAGNAKPSSCFALDVLCRDAHLLQAPPPPSKTWPTNSEHCRHHEYRRTSLPKIPRYYRGLGILSRGLLGCRAQYLSYKYNPNSKPDLNPNPTNCPIKKGYCDDRI